MTAPKVPLVSVLTEEDIIAGNGFIDGRPARITIERFRIIRERYVDCPACGATGVNADRALTQAEIVAIEDDGGWTENLIAGQSCRECRGAGRTSEAVVPPVEEIIEQIPTTVVEVQAQDVGPIARTRLRALRLRVEGAEREDHWRVGRPARHVMLSVPLDFDRPLLWDRWTGTYDPAPLPPMRPGITAVSVSLGPSEVRLALGVWPAVVE